MAVTSFTIGGAEVDPIFETLEIRETAGGVSTLSCEIRSEGSPTVRYSVHQVISIEEDSVVIFAGTITQTRERGFGGPNNYDEDGAPHIITTITAEDFNRIAERVYITEDVADGTTLETFLTTLVDDYLDQFGVTLDASQATGPSLPAMSFSFQRANDVLNALADATGYVWRIDYDKALRMWQPGDIAAPFDIDEFDTPAKWTGDVEVENILGDEYANRVIVKVPDQIIENFQETRMGDGVWDSWELTYKIHRHNQFVNGNPNGAYDPAGGFWGPLGDGHPTGPTWIIESDNQTITNIVSTPPSGYAITITYDGLLQITATAEDAAEIAANGLVEHVEVRSDVTTQDAADALAAQILAERLQAGSEVVKYDTRQYAPTLRAGQQQTITATARNLSGSYTIRDMGVRAETPVTAVYDAAGLGFIRTITAKKSNPLQGKFEYTYRDWLGDKSDETRPVAVGSGVPQVIAAHPPDKAVQFNREGGFGGDAAFTYYEDENSLVCGGGGSSITAASHESCQVFGYNNHIPDP